MVVQSMPIGHAILCGMHTSRQCEGCGVTLTIRHQIRFCSNKCQMDVRYRLWVKEWKAGNIDGNIGIQVRNFSGHLRRYLTEKFRDKCALCGWNTKHPVTGVVPLEVDHIDGDAENSVEENLRLLCPNCHALTPFYRNLNEGNGRKWRTEQYRRGRASADPHALPLRPRPY